MKILQTNTKLKIQTHWNPQIHTETIPTQNIGTPITYPISCSIVVGVNKHINRVTYSEQSTESEDAWVEYYDSTREKIYYIK